MPLLGYWKIRGLAQPIRLLMGYVEENMDEKFYDKWDEWSGEKFNLGLDFPNLPYYVDGDLKLTQSNAILRHLARKYGLMGKTELEQNLCDMAAEQVVDLRRAFLKICYGGGEPYPFSQFRENLTKFLTPMEKFLEGKEFLAGASLTWADFIFWEMLDQLLLFKPGYLDPLPNINAYHQRFKELPTIKKYIESDKFFVGPNNGMVAVWGGQYPVEPPQ